MVTTLRREPTTLNKKGISRISGGGGSTIGEPLSPVLFSSLKFPVTFHAPVIQIMTLRVSWQIFIVRPKGMDTETLEKSLSPKSRLVTLKVWPLNL